MNIWEQCRKILRERWKSGMTQQDIAERAELSRGHIQGLLNNTRQIEDLSVQNFLKLFPEMTVVQKDSLSVSSELSPQEDKLLSMFRNLTEREQLDAIVLLATTFSAADKPTRKIG